MRLEIKRKEGYGKKTDKTMSKIARLEKKPSKMLDNFILSILNQQLNHKLLKSFIILEIFLILQAFIRNFPN